MAWFEETVKAHPSEDGWKIIVFTHAPPNGSGLRVLQENHVVNGCCWLNHSNEKVRKKYAFIFVAIIYFMSHVEFLLTLLICIQIALLYIHSNAANSLN
jgi:hypothetical protein